MINPATGNEIVEITAVGGAAPTITGTDNLAQVGGTTVLAGNGVTGAGSQRVTIASDNTPFPVKIDQTTPGTTNAVAIIAGQNGVAGGSGANSATVQRVTVATDDTVATDLTSIRKSTSGAGAPSIDSYTHAAISAAVTTADQSLVSAPGANKQIWVYGINFVTAAAGTVSFQDEDNTAISGVMSLGANGGMAVGPSGNFAMPLWKVATNKALEVDTASGADAKGWLSYAIVSV